MFNLCMPYTSRDEIATAVRSAIKERLESGSEDRCVLFAHKPR